MNIRNICIIAHVDHGKTTLVDHLLRQAGAFSERAALEDRAMDSMDLERERGITIQAKNAAIQYKDLRINIVDTPGHSDFGGEVERILGMVDGAVLLVDAAEGPLPQTRFVLQKALERGHRIILCINKVDRPECRDGLRTAEVVNQTFDLFIDLGASEEQADFPIVYACAKEGWCTTDTNEIPALIAKEKKGSLTPLFDLVANSIASPKISDEPSFQMAVANLGWSDFVGRLAIGRITAGSLVAGQRAYRFGTKEDGTELTEGFSVTKLFRYQGMKQVEVTSLEAGDVGVVAGSESFQIGDTIGSEERTPRLARIDINKPTLAMVFSVNTAPFSGRDGDALQSRKLRERLLREVRMNVAVRFEDTSEADKFRLLGRGELQFAILIEQMRREGSEFMVGQTPDAGFDITYCFRLTQSGTILNAYTTYAELTTSPERDFEVQRGTITITGTSTLLAAGVDYVAPSASTSAFIRITNSHHTGAGSTLAGTQNADDVTAYILNPANIMTSVRIARPSTATGNTRVSWEIIEFIGTAGSDNEMIVRAQTTLTYGTTATTATGTTISGIINDTDVVVFITGQLNPDIGAANYNTGESTSEWEAGGNVPVFTRGEAGGDASIVCRTKNSYTGPSKM